MLRSVSVIALVSLNLSCCNSQNTCDFNLKVTQELHNGGFHRNMTYSISFNSEDETGRWLPTDCIVGLDQTLPAGVYANPDELGDLHRLGKLNVIPKNRISIELPTEQSSQSSVFVIGKVTSDNMYLWLPVHARYHQAVSRGGTARNEIHPPKLYLRCSDERLALCEKLPSVSFLCNGGSRAKCSWKQIPFRMMTDTLIWEVPVGNTDHYYVVASGTGLVIVLGSHYLLQSIHEYKLRTKKKQC